MEEDQAGPDLKGMDISDPRIRQMRAVNFLVDMIVSYMEETNENQMSWQEMQRRYERMMQKETCGNARLCSLYDKHNQYLRFDDMPTTLDKKAVKSLTGKNAISKALSESLFQDKITHSLDTETRTGELMLGIHGYKDNGDNANFQNRARYYAEEDFAAELERSLVEESTDCTGLDGNPSMSSSPTHKGDCFAIIERLFDDRDRPNCEAEMDFVNTICNSAGIAGPVDGWRYEPKGRRVGDPAASAPPKPRPLRVKFRNRKERDDFLDKYDRFLPPSWRRTFPGQRPTARREMTSSELQRLFELRKECCEKNQLAGKVEFVVKDLSIVKRKSASSRPPSTDSINVPETSNNEVEILKEIDELTQVVVNGRELRCKHMRVTNFLVDMIHDYIEETNNYEMPWQEIQNRYKTMMEQKENAVSEKLQILFKKYNHHLDFDHLPATLDKKTIKMLTERSTISKALSEDIFQEKISFSKDSHSFNGLLTLTFQGYRKLDDKTKALDLASYYDEEDIEAERAGTRDKTLKKIYTSRADSASSFIPPTTSSNGEFVQNLVRNYENFKVLGFGAFGVVMKVRNKIDEQEYAIKRIAVDDRNVIVLTSITPHF